MFMYVRIYMRLSPFFLLQLHMPTMKLHDNCHLVIILHKFEMLWLTAC